jgi:hypothetical protein
MEISAILTVSYFVVGILCAYHWFEEDYGEEYRKAREEGEEEKGMTCMLLLFLTSLWPFIFVFKAIKAL